MCLFGFDNCRSVLSWIVLFSLLLRQTKLSSAAQVVATTEEGSTKPEKGVDPVVHSNGCVTCRDFKEQLNLLNLKVLTFWLGMEGWRMGCELVLLINRP
ncbi:hypothetical protein TNCV_1333791 [Trichonephila clavipes]|nr:hypothetical protein TNCV_1333791 [Trichonephila clavipes]